MIKHRWFQFMGMLMLLSVGLCFYGVKDAGAIEFYGIVGLFFRKSKRSDVFQTLNFFMFSKWERGVSLL